MRASPHWFTGSVVDDASTGACAEVGQACSRQSGFGDHRARDPTAVIPAKQDCARHAGVRDADVPDEVGQLRPGWHFEHGARRPSRQSDQHGPWLGRVADRSEPLGTVSSDERDMGQRFDIVDQRGASAHPGRRGKHSPVARQGRTALDPRG